MADTLANHKFFKPNVSEKWLKNNGFYKDNIMSDEESVAYSYRFPCYRYGEYNTLDCVVSIYNDGKAIVNCYDHNTRDRYAAFYYVEYGDFTPIIDTIYRNIFKEFKKLGIDEVTK